MKDFKGRLSRTKRKNIPLKDIEKFSTPEHFTLFNYAVTSIENRIRKKYSARAYRELIDRFCGDILFNKYCRVHLKEPELYTKPSFSKINSTGKYTPNNLKLNKLKNKTTYKFNKTLESEMRSIDTCMKDSVGYSFLMQFDDPKKIRFLLLAIKGNGQKSRDFNFGKAEKQAYILKFYGDKKFNKLYRLFLKSKNRYIRPSLDHKIPLSRNGTHDLSNLHFISFLENISKNEMTWKDWTIIKKNLDKFMDF